MTSDTRYIDPYAEGKVPDGAFGAQATIHGRMIAIMDLRIKGRNLQLQQYRSRAFPAGSICELVQSPNINIRPGDTAQDGVYLGFAVIETPALIIVGNLLDINSDRIGPVLGFDETHMPNHYNVVLANAMPVTGVEAGYSPGDSLSFSQPAAKTTSNSRRQ